MDGGPGLVAPDPERYPVDAVADDVRAALGRAGAVVVVAPPGTGKTTRLPLLLAERGAGDRLLVTEPRRVATRAAAARLASTLGEPIGSTVGYRMRDEVRVGPSTRIEVVTEGVFVRLLQADPSLEGVSTVLFDEVHERSLDIDVSLALALDARAVLRPDLRVVVMSATLEGERYASLLDAPIVAATAQVHPLAVDHRPALAAQLDRGVEDALREVLQTPDHGDVLVFLPGAREIRAAGRRLERSGLGRGLAVHELTGSTAPDQAAAALSPDPLGRAKVVLATAVAQTSLTVPGVRTVIDSGLSRRATFEPDAAVTRLVTERVSRATATQRAGRAAREAPGRVVRLWSAADYDRSVESDVPEIADADLTDVVLQLALWGVRDPAALRWVDAPPTAHWTAAREVLVHLGALDPDGATTDVGRRLGRLPTGARIGRLLLDAEASGDADTVDRACRLAAELSGGTATPARLRRLLGTPPAAQRPPSSDGSLAAHAFPERIAARAGTDPARYVLTSGITATLADDDPNRGASLIVAVDLDGDRRSGRIFRSVVLRRDELDQVVAATPGLALVVERVPTMLASGRVEVVAATRLGACVIERRSVDATEDDVLEAVLAAVDLRTLLDVDRVRILLARIALLRSAEPHDWPEWTVDELAATASTWLVPHLRGRPARDPLGGIDLAEVLLSTLDHPTRRRLDRDAPRRVAIPSGREVEVDYLDPGGPTIHAKLQEFFGARTGPRIAGGRVAVRMSLLSPAGRPAAVTDDLERFWAGGYLAVRAELRGRYPKHPWPDDPATAVPTARTKARS